MEEDTSGCGTRSSFGGGEDRLLEEDSCWRRQLLEEMTGSWEKAGFWTMKKEVSSWRRRDADGGNRFLVEEAGSWRRMEARDVGTITGVSK